MGCREVRLSCNRTQGYNIVVSFFDTSEIIFDFYGNKKDD